MKLLTGKCLADFTHWYDGYIRIDNDRLISGTDINYFSFLIPSMQFGVIQDFGDSVGINITLYQLDYQEWYGYNIVKFGKPVITGGVWRRNKAREEAIKQFNKIYNETN